MRALTMEELDYVSGGDDVTVVVTGSSYSGGLDELYMASYDTPSYISVSSAISITDDVMDGAKLLADYYNAVWRAAKGEDINQNGSKIDETKWLTEVAVAHGMSVKALAVAAASSLLQLSAVIWRRLQKLHSQVQRGL